MMTIQFRCPHCQNAIALRDEFAGETGTCNKCHKRLVVPDPTGLLVQPSQIPEPQRDHSQPLRVPAVAAPPQSSTVRPKKQQSVQTKLRPIKTVEIVQTAIRTLPVKSSLLRRIPLSTVIASSLVLLLVPWNVALYVGRPQTVADAVSTQTKNSSLKLAALEDGAEKANAEIRELNSQLETANAQLSVIAAASRNIQSNAASALTEPETRTPTDMPDTATNVSESAELGLLVSTAVEKQKPDLLKSSAVNTSQKPDDGADGQRSLGNVAVLRTYTTDVVYGPAGYAFTPKTNGAKILVVVVSASSTTFRYTDEEWKETFSDNSTSKDKDPKARVYDPKRFSLHLSDGTAVNGDQISKCERDKTGNYVADSFCSKYGNTAVSDRDIVAIAFAIRNPTRATSIQIDSETPFVLKVD